MLYLVCPLSPCCSFLVTWFDNVACTLIFQFLLSPSAAFYFDTILYNDMHSIVMTFYDFIGLFIIYTSLRLAIFRIVFFPYFWSCPKGEKGLFYASLSIIKKGEDCCWLSVSEMFLMMSIITWQWLTWHVCDNMKMLICCPDSRLAN